jgi:hypothetical protein
MEPKFELLFQLRIDVDQAVELGRTPYGALRRIDIFLPGSRFDGPRLKGRVVGGIDARLTRFDEVFHPDVRILLETDDGHPIHMTYQGYRSGPAEVWARLDRGEPIDPSEYYFRIAARFETGSDKYDWVNRVMAFGSGVRVPEGPIYDIYQVL